MFSSLEDWTKTPRESQIFMLEIKSGLRRRRRSSHGDKSVQKRALFINICHLFTPLSPLTCVIQPRQGENITCIFNDDNDDDRNVFASHTPFLCARHEYVSLLGNLNRFSSYNVVGLNISYIFSRDLILLAQVVVWLSRTYAHSEWNIFNEKRETLFKRLLFIFFSATAQVIVRGNDEIPFNLLLKWKEAEISYRKKEFNRFI